MAIKHSFKPGVSNENTNEYGLTNYCSWERLLPYLNEAAGINIRKQNEVITGIVADENGIKIIMDYQK